MTSLTDKSEVILFGFGNIGQIVADSLIDKNLKLSAIVDNDSRKWGQKVNNLEIISPNKLSSELLSAATFLITVTDIQDALLQLSDLFDKRSWISLPDYIKFLQEPFDIDFNHYSELQSVSSKFLEYVWKSCVNYQDVVLNSDSPPLRSLELIITERCTLKCKDCSNLMQYYSKPKNEEHEDVIVSLKSILSSVSWINEVRVLGGEPFLNKDIHNVYDFLNSAEKVQNVVTYTNGTLLPSDDVFSTLTHPKNLVLITDYGDLSRNKSALSDAFIKFGVKYRKEPAGGWTDCGTVVELDRSVSNLKKTFQECCAKNLITLSEGSLYRCPFAAHIERLGFQDFPQDRLPLSDLSKTNSDNILNDFLFNKEYISACSYCKGRRLSDPKIVPGIQSKTVIPLPSA